MANPILAPATEQGLQDTLTALNVKWYTGNFVELAENFTENVVFDYTSQNEVIVGIANCMNDIATFRANSTNVAITDQTVSSVQVNGNSGTISYKLTATYNQSGQSWEEENKCTFTFDYLGDRWSGSLLDNKRNRRVPA